MRGDIVIFTFPHSDLTTGYPRPTLILKKLGGDDAICCLVTLQTTDSPYAIPLSQVDIISGYLKNDSYVRPDRLFTADTNKFIKTVCTVSQSKFDEILRSITQIFC